MSIDRFPTTDQIDSADGVIIRKHSSLLPVVFSVADFLELLRQSGDDTFGDLTFSLPAAQAATVTLTRQSDVTRVYVQSGGALPAVTFILPAVAGLSDNDTLFIHTNQPISALAFSLNGATDVLGEPSALAANAALQLNYRAANLCWYKR